MENVPPFPFAVGSVTMTFGRQLQNARVWVRNSAVFFEIYDHSMFDRAISDDLWVSGNHKVWLNEGFPGFYANVVEVRESLTKFVFIPAQLAIAVV